MKLTIEIPDVKSCDYCPYRIHVINRCFCGIFHRWLQIETKTDLLPSYIKCQGCLEMCNQEERRGDDLRK